MEGFNFRYHYFKYFLLFHRQILDLLAKQSSLMRDRQLLGKEVEFLRAQVASPNESDLDKLVTSRRTLVDDVLHNAQRSDQDGQEKHQTENS